MQEEDVAKTKAGGKRTLPGVEEAVLRWRGFAGGGAVAVAAERKRFRFFGGSPYSFYFSLFSVVLFSFFYFQFAPFLPSLSLVSSLSLLLSPLFRFFFLSSRSSLAPSVFSLFIGEKGCWALH